MCGVLVRVNNKPQSEWRDSRLTLNGVIALLATITKAALMVPVAEAISQRKWLWFLPKGQQGGQKVRDLQDFEAFDNASRGSPTLHASAKAVKYPDFQSIFVAGPGTNTIFRNTAAVGGSQPHLILGNFIFIGQPRNAYFQRHADRKTSEPLQISDLIAAECGLWYCLQAHDVGVSFGNIVQSHTDHWNEAQSRLDFNDVDKLNFTNIPASFNLDPGTVYGVHRRAFRSIVAALDRLLQGEVRVREDPDNLDNPDAEFKFLTPDGSGHSDSVQAVWNYADNLDTWISNLALSMSNHIRLTGTAQVSKRYAGTAWASVVFVKVRWVYLTFPIAMVILSIAFWIFSVIETLQSPAKPWKSSALAVLYARLDQELQNEAANGLLEEDDLGKYVHRRKVLLSDQEDGWVFRSPLR
ncbi:hypothetical protein LTR28_011805 [Elasticomyces elasticus]|nr:hypothetical protein LTR28_011805 [Elasticomyces elasticus]